MWLRPKIEIVDLSEFELFAISSLSLGCDRVKCCNDF